MRRYVHIGTGNYNPKTARLYTDFGLLHGRPRAGRRPHRPLQRADRLRRARRLSQADRGAAGDAGSVHRDDPAGGRHHARAGRPARILAKMNALVDPDIIAALYEASQAGVHDRSDRPRDLLPAARAPGREREDPGDQHHRALPGALAGVLLPERRRRRRSTSARPTGCRATSTAGSRRWCRSQNPAHRQTIRDLARADVAATTGRRGTWGRTGPTRSGSPSSPGDRARNPPHAGGAAVRG